MKRFIKIALVTSVVLFVFILTKPVAADDKYVVTKKSNKYHHPSCRWAQKFRSKNMVTFRSANDALGAGYVPCKVCKPPGED